MSLKQEIETWAQGLEAYDAQDFDKALELFQTIADSSKILFNIGLIHATLGNHELAVENYNASNALDQYLAVSYFQCGVSNFLLGRYEDARRDFEDAYVYLRGNMTIDYEQIGLKFRLYSCEVLFNKGLSLIYMGREEEGMANLSQARNEKQTGEHGVIDEAFADRGDGYTVFSIPVGVLYRPPESKLKNLKAKNYLGKAKLVAATEMTDAFIGFTGSEKAKASDLSRSKTSAGRVERTASPALDLAPTRRPNPIETFQQPTLAPAPIPVVTTKSVPQRSNTVNLLPSQRSEQLDIATTREASRYVDDLLNDYSDYPPPPVPQGQSQDRVADWAAQNGNIKPSRGFEGDTPIVKRSQTTKTRRADLDEEVYASDDDTTPKQMKKIRLKIYFAGDVRAMSINPSISFFEFVDRIRGKFDLDSTPLMKFKDEDGVQVSIKDEDDWEAAIDEARAAAKGRAEGKLELTVS